MGSYSYLAACSNCHTAQEYAIPKGTAASEFMAGQICTNCGFPMVAKGNGHTMSDKGRVAGL